MKNLDNTFRVARKKWGGNGSGSTPDKTKVLVEFLSQLVIDLKITKVIDFGCGSVDWILPAVKGIEYVGVDVVPEVVQENVAKGINCVLWTRDCVLPSGDDRTLVLSRDTFAHLSNATCLAFLEKLKQTGAKYLLVSHTTGTRNRDIKDGEFRSLNMQGLPFLWPEADLVIHEGESIKSMGLWEFSQIMKNVAVEAPRTPPAPTIPLPTPFAAVMAENAAESSVEPFQDA